MKRTYIAIVLDRSGSMKTCREATIKGLNEQIATIRKEASEPNISTYVSFYTFNSQVEPRYKCKSVNFLEDITNEDYVTKGDTAIYDAVGQAINDLVKETDSNNPDNSYLVITVTDGDERCSKKFSLPQLSRLIQEKQDTGKWTFTYLGANQNLEYVARTLNIPQGNIANYKSDTKGSTVAWRHSNAQLDNFLKLRKRGFGQLKSFFSNNGNITDFEKIDMVSPAPEFDVKSLNLETAKPDEKNIDLDKVLGIHKNTSPKAYSRKE